MKIVITDSGMGGLSVVAELEKRLKQHPIYKYAELIFFNSLYSSDYGYNSMKSMKEKAIVFNNALNSIVRNYNPDLILIACNTLSVVYPHTKFSAMPATKVEGIVESGVLLFSNAVKKKDDTVIVFGTPTTITSDVYKRELIKTGIDESQIVNQSCPNLETEIQNNPSGERTLKLISEFVNEAKNKIKNNVENIYAALCCTHYGYSKDMFHDELSKEYGSKVEILNPNNTMIDFLFSDTEKLHNDSRINVKVVSQVKLKDNEIESLSNILRKESPLTARALENYEFKENLFSSKE